MKYIYLLNIENECEYYEDMEDNKGFRYSIKKRKTWTWKKVMIMRKRKRLLIDKRKCVKIFLKKIIIGFEDEKWLKVKKKMKRTYMREGEKEKIFNKRI